MTPPSTYDGRHLLADLYGCPVLDDATLIETALRAAADSAGATVIGSGRSLGPY
jgi:S-adenosylmethionine decarboxylase